MAYYNPNNQLIWVQGEEAAKAYMVAPNSTMVLWDTDSPVIYLKQCDSMGRPSMTILDFTVRDKIFTYIIKDNTKEAVQSE